MLEKQINSIYNVYHVSDGWNLASISYAEVQDMTVAMDIYGERAGQVLYLGLHSNFIKNISCVKKGGPDPPRPPSGSAPVVI